MVKAAIINKRKDSSCVLATKYDEELNVGRASQCRNIFGRFLLQYSTLPLLV